jgi:hypothetical protein
VMTATFPCSCMKRLYFLRRQKSIVVCEQLDCEQIFRNETASLAF